MGIQCKNYTFKLEWEDHFDSSIEQINKMIKENAFFPVKDGMTLIEYFLKLEEIFCQKPKYKFWYFIQRFRFTLLLNNSEIYFDKSSGLLVVRDDSVERDPSAKFPEMLFEKFQNKQSKFLEFCQKQLPDYKFDAVEQELKKNVSCLKDESKKGEYAFKLYFTSFEHEIILGFQNSFPALTELSNKLKSTRFGKILMVPSSNANGDFQWCFYNRVFSCYISIDQIKIKALKYFVILISNFFLQIKNQVKVHMS